MATIIEKETFLSKAIDISEALPEHKLVWEAIEPSMLAILAANTAAGNERLSALQMVYSRQKFAEQFLATMARDRKKTTKEEKSAPLVPRAERDAPKKAAAAAKEPVDYAAFVGNDVQAQWEDDWHDCELVQFDATRRGNRFEIKWKEAGYANSWVAAIRNADGKDFPTRAVVAPEETAPAEPVAAAPAPKPKAKPSKDPAADRKELIRIADEALKARNAATVAAVVAEATPKKGDRKSLVTCSDAVLVQVAIAVGSTVPADKTKLSGTERADLLKELAEADITEAVWYGAETAGPYYVEEAKPTKKAVTKSAPPAKPAPAPNRAKAKAAAAAKAAPKAVKPVAAPVKATPAKPAPKAKRAA